MEIINGKGLADDILATLQDANQAEGLRPCLAILDVGENPTNKHYIGLKTRAATAINGKTRVIELGEATSRQELLTCLATLNQDDSVDGILLQLPLPEGLAVYQDQFLAAINPAKDVDGFSPHNQGLLINGEPDFISCAAMACLEVSRRYAGPLRWKKVLLIGESFDLIRTLAVCFIREGCRVTVIPEHDPGSLAEFDVVVIEKGSPLMVAPEGIKEGALLIDAGFYWEDGRTCGNVDRTRMDSATGYLLPVPGGMGPLLVAHLMINLSRAARRFLRDI